jgi:hypothetical protein
MSNIGAFIVNPGMILRQSNPFLRVAVLSGNGKIFCAGADLVE